MAVNYELRVSRPLLSGLIVTPGSAVLIGLRVLVLLLAALPAWFAVGGVAEKNASRAFFTGVEDRLPWAQYFEMFSTLIEAFGGALPLVLILTLGLKAFLEGGALRWLALQNLGDAPEGFWRGFLSAGAAWFRPMVWTMLLSGALLAIGLVVLVLLFGLLTGGGGPLADDATAYRTYLGTAAVLALCFLLYSTLVGAFVFWLRVAMVVQDHRNLFRELGSAVMVFLKAPFRGPFFYIVVALVSLAAGAFVIGLWRDTAPRDGMLMVFGLAWLGLLFVQAFLWHWVLRAGINLATQDA